MLVRADDVARLLWEAFKRRWAIGLVVLLVVICADMFATLKRPRAYTTEAKLVAKAAARGTFIPIDAPAETYAELLTERPVAERVAVDLRLGITAPELLRHVVVHGVGVTPVLALDVSWATPEMSAMIANHLAEAFVERQRELIASRSTQSIALIANELPGAIGREVKAARALAAFQSRNGTVDMAASANSLLDSLGSVDRKIRDTEVEAGDAGSTAASLTQQGNKLPATIPTQRTYGQDPGLVELRSQLASATAKRDEARGEYGPKYPGLIASEREVAALQAQIASQPAQVMVNENVAPNSIVQNLETQRLQELGRLASAQFRLGELHRQHDALARAFAGVPAKTATFATLKREAQLSANVVAALEQKSNEAVLARYSAASDVAIVQSAVAQNATVMPNLHNNLSAALVVGTVLAIVAVLAIDFFDDRIRNVRDLAAADVALPVLATIPNMGGTDLAVAADAFGELVASLRNDTAARSYAIVSPLAGDGKSTVALALARTLGEIEPGVLLVDADFRGPTLHERVARPRSPGLSDVLSGRAEFADVVSRVAPGVHFVTSGSAVQNALTLLQGPQFEAFLATARAVYRIVVIDGPGLEPVMDGAVIASRCDAAILVIASNRTASRDLRFALQRLEIAGSARIAGIVLNSPQGPRKPPAALVTLSARLTGGVSA
jgi:succinoglycan biosynthesis transport protein ExoP